MSAPSLALSTMYFQRWIDQSDLTPFFETARAAGFDRFELSHILSHEAVASADAEREAIASVHHPCPNEGAGDTGTVALREHRSLMARDGQARQREAERIRRTIDTAAILRASDVVVHLGTAEDDQRETCRRLRFELVSRYQAGQKGAPAFDAARRRLADWLDAVEDAHLERAAALLTDVVSYADERGVRLALETGYHAHELPRPGGMRHLLALVPGLGAWLDTGHVGAQANLGLARFDDWFAAVGDRWWGVHFHDVTGLRDHLVPGAGTLDFAALAHRLPPSITATVEVDWYFSAAELETGRRTLASALASVWSRQTGS